MAGAAAGCLGGEAPIGAGSCLGGGLYGRRAGILEQPGLAVEFCRPVVQWRVAAAVGQADAVLMKLAMSWYD